MEEEKVTPEYFESIYNLLSIIGEHAPWAKQVLGKLQLLKMDVRFLEVFCLCLETWDYSTDKEESMENLRCMVTPLNVIWPDKQKGFSLLYRLANTFSPDMLIQDFHPAIFEMEAKIQQSKQLFEGWCENLMHSSMQFKFSTFSSYRIIWNLLQHLLKDLNDFSSYRAAKIIPLKQQIDIMKDKIVFLQATLKNVDDCLYTKEILQFLNFSCVFANKAACLTCLYWAKESNEEIATEMNIIFFDMLQRYIPSASDIAPLYVGILKSYSLKASDSFLLGEAAEGVVEFFFHHLTSILKDDFLILRDRLIFLFTFLINPPCENAEEDSIRSQIYSLFREDAYLLLPFDEMKDDFSDKKMLLGDCMIKIDLAKSSIRQLDNKFSDSRIRSEVDKLEFIHFASLQRELISIEKHARWASQVMDQLPFYIIELRFLKMSLLCFATWDDTDEEIWVRLKSMITSLQGIWESKEEKGLLAPRLQEICTGVITDWHPLALELEEKIQLSKVEIHAWWVNLFHRSLQCKPPTSYTILKLLESVLNNLEDLVNFKAGEIVPYGKQVETLKEKLVFLKKFLKLGAICLYSKELGEFKLLVQVFANDAACLTFLYWTIEANDEVANETNDILSHMMQKIKPATPDVARLYFGVLKAIYVQRSDSQMFGETASEFADLFLEDAVTLTPWKDEFRILRDDIIFLLTFLNDPPSENTEEIICSRIDVLFWEDVYGLLPFGDREMLISDKFMVTSPIHPFTIFQRLFLHSFSIL